MPYPSIRERFNRHLRRTGADRAYHDDPLTQLTVNLTKDLLALVQAALDDEGVDPATADRVLDRVIYGAVPLPEHVAEQRRKAQHMIGVLSRAPLSFPVGRPEDGEVPSGR